MQTPSTSKASPALLTLPPYDTTSPSRLQSLYSDISRQKHSNPASYNANIEWWRKALETVVRSGIQSHGSTLVLSAGPGLMDLLRVPGAGKPLALASVVTELRTQKVLFTRSDFLNSTQSVYDSGWLPGRIAAYVVGKPLWWALEQLGVVGDEGFISTARDEKDTTWWGDYVAISLVEATANNILTKQSLKPGGPGDTLYSFEGFKQEFSSILSDSLGSLPDADAKILLRFLERDRRAVIVDKDIIKFINPDNTSGVREITSIDRGILELKDAVRHLHAQITELQRRQDEYTKKASVALQQKHKPVALTFLRSRKQFEGVLLKRLGSLETLEATLASVETAAGNVELMKSYQSSTATLRAILSHPSLQKNSIEKTMDAMADATADAGEVDESIRIGGNVALGIDTSFDEAELEEELEKLAREAEADKTQSKLGHGALKTPTELPLPAESEQLPQRQAVPLG
ncbi:Snf7-domain-containing protein [Mycena maculata]|uniref:Snf7-domain-containing protein n=1 Tax=Mycena maculata TaxID=230809 RepID=A0AAD7HN81_9AGAR|nr:Snf7-domain-containing protein [Mycena maculata]